MKITAIAVRKHGFLLCCYDEGGGVAADPAVDVLEEGRTHPTPRLAVAKTVSGKSVRKGCFFTHSNRTPAGFSSNNFQRNRA
jgi:hypothetical protein